MDARDLHTIWSAPDNTHLTPKQFTFRLPVHVAAKLQALGEMYPHKTRTEIVADLLTVALDQVEASFPPVKGNALGTEPDSDFVIYDDVGQRLTFRQLTNKHWQALEAELGNAAAKPLYDSTPCFSDGTVDEALTVKLEEE